MLKQLHIQSIVPLNSVFSELIFSFNLISFPSHARMLFSQLIAVTLTSISQVNDNIWLTLFSWSNMFSSRTDANSELRKHLSSEKISSLWSLNQGWEWMLTVLTRLHDLQLIMLISHIFWRVSQNGTAQLLSVPSYEPNYKLHSTF